MPSALAALVLAAALTGALAGDPAFDEGVRLYRALEYEQAIFRFQEVAVRPSLDATDKATALVWLGLAYAGTGDLDAAKRMFGDALRADPAARLPPDVSPRVVQVFDEVKASLPAPADPGVPPTPSDATASPQAPTSPPPGTNPDANTGGWVLPATLTGLGAVTLVGGGVLAVLAANDWGTATDPDEFQDVAKAAADASALETVGASVLLPAGAVLTGLGVMLLAVDSGD